ncbi:MAG: SAM-dependent methyltransferase [Nevskia sp.]|nr:SAM-dependent methyltransferase [Nevskia sp.]
MIEIEPVAYVRSARREPVDDGWDAVPARIELVESLGPECLEGLAEFSHAEILFHFHLAAPEAVVRGARHLRGNRDWPLVGIFAQRGKDRPNRLGSTIVEILGRDGRSLEVRGLDAIDGTPVLDIKPVMTEFLPRTPVRQPAWAHQLMRGYWSGYLV